MNLQMATLGRAYVPRDVLTDSLSTLQRRDLCRLQLVSRLFTDFIDTHLPIYPTHPSRLRFHLVVTTEDRSTFSRSGDLSDRYLFWDVRSNDDSAPSTRAYFPHFSLKDNSTDPPRRSIPDYANDK